VGEAEGGVRAAEGGAEDEAEDDEEGGVGGAGGRVKVDGRVMEEEGRREEGERESRRVALIMMVPGYEAGEDTEVGVGKAFDKGLGEDLGGCVCTESTSIGTSLGKVPIHPCLLDFVKGVGGMEGACWNSNHTASG